MHPPLTTLAQDKAGLGVAAARALLRQIEGADTAEPVTLPVELIVRGSTAAAPPGGDRGQGARHAGASSVTKIVFVARRRKRHAKQDHVDRLGRDGPGARRGRRCLRRRRRLGLDASASTGADADSLKGQTVRLWIMPNGPDPKNDIDKLLEPFTAEDRHHGRDRGRRLGRDAGPDPQRGRVGRGSGHHAGGHDAGAVLRGAAGLRGPRRPRRGHRRRGRLPRGRLADDRRSPARTASGRCRGSPRRARSTTARTSWRRPASTEDGAFADWDAMTATLQAIKDKVPEIDGKPIQPFGSPGKKAYDLVHHVMPFVWDAGGAELSRRQHEVDDQLARGGAGRRVLRRPAAEGPLRQEPAAARRHAGGEPVQGRPHRRLDRRPVDVRLHGPDRRRELGPGRAQERRHRADADRARRRRRLHVRRRLEPDDVQVGEEQGRRLGGHEVHVLGRLPDQVRRAARHVPVAQRAPAGDRGQGPGLPVLVRGDPAGPHVRRRSRSGRRSRTPTRRTSATSSTRRAASAAVVQRRHRDDRARRRPPRKRTRCSRRARAADPKRRCPPRPSRRRGRPSRPPRPPARARHARPARRRRRHTLRLRADRAGGDLHAARAHRADAGRRGAVVQEPQHVHVPPAVRGAVDRADELPGDPRRVQPAQRRVHGRRLEHRPLHVLDGRRHASSAGWRSRCCSTATCAGRSGRAR